MSPKSPTCCTDIISRTPTWKVVHPAYSACQFPWGSPAGEKRQRNPSFSRELAQSFSLPSPVSQGEVRLCCGYNFGGFPCLFHNLGLYGSTWDLCYQLPVEAVDALIACLTCFLEAFWEPHDGLSHVSCVFSHQLQTVALIRWPPVQQEMDPKHSSFLHTTNHWTTVNTCGSLPF